MAEDVPPNEVAKKLSEGYSPTTRAIEITSVIVFFTCQAGLLSRLWGTLELSFVGWAVVILGSCLLADFISGLFHWAGDTWGSPDMPLIGKLFVRPFREHHVDALAITRHDFFEVTGGNCAISVPWFAVLFLDIEGMDNTGRAGVAFLGLFLFWIFVTSLAHRWAHAERVPRFVRPLQRWGLLLSPAHHAQHHVPPHTTSYCITGGWLNRALDAIGFFRRFEWVVNKTTGLVPREDDAATLVASNGESERYSDR